MPLYDYKCPSCGHRFEARHGFDDNAPACPSCGHDEVTRVIGSAPTVAGGMLTNAGSSEGATKEQLKSKWAEETPKLRKQLESKLGKDYVQKNAPHLYNNIDS